MAGRPVRLDELTAERSTDLRDAGYRIFRAAGISPIDPMDPSLSELIGAYRINPTLIRRISGTFGHISAVADECLRNPAIESDDMFMFFLVPRREAPRGTFPPPLREGPGRVQR